MDGFLNLNKPAGFTSHDCVAKVRRSLQMKRVGHAGTLDPAATGVLPIALGRATRLLQFLPGEKRYRAVIRFGLTTSTDDLEGEILTQATADHLDMATVQAVLPQFQGTFQQLPPHYSAVQVGGKRLYDLAREGKAINVQARTVDVSQITVLDWRSQPFPEIELNITCGAGTYIRAIARDLGAILQTGATLATLQRTESSGFRLEDSLTLDDVNVLAQQSQVPLVPPDIALRALESLVLSADIARRWCLGQRIAWGDLATDHMPTGPIRIHHESGEFLGIAQRQLRQGGYVLAPDVVYVTIGSDDRPQSSAR